MRVIIIQGKADAMLAPPLIHFLKENPFVELEVRMEGEQPYKSLNRSLEEYSEILGDTRTEDYNEEQQVAAINILTLVRVIIAKELLRASHK